MGRNTCDKCGGKGFVSLGKGIRGIKKCVACRGKGELIARCLDCGKPAPIDSENSNDSWTAYKTTCDSCGGRAALFY